MSLLVKYYIRFINPKFYCINSTSTSRRHCYRNINTSACKFLNTVAQTKVEDYDEIIHGKNKESVSILKEQEVLQDVSHVGPPIPISFNFAAYANRSEVIQRLIDLGVNFYEIENKKDVPTYLLLLDFEKDIKPYINFLVDKGVNAENLGDFFTRNPFFFKNDLDDLQVRINYLESKKFTSDMITKVITKYPQWLNFTTIEVDRRLGLLQDHFCLKGYEMRKLITSFSKIISVRDKNLLELVFLFKDVEKFTFEQYKNILLKQPYIFQKSQSYIKHKLDFLVIEMEIPHEMIAREPYIFSNRLGRIKERHLFLKSIGKAQYNPKLPNFVSLKALTHGNDVDFCKNVTKTPVEMYNMFLKTL